MAQFRSSLTRSTLPLLQAGRGQDGLNAVRTQIGSTIRRLLGEALGVQSEGEIDFAFVSIENEAHEASLLNRFRISEERFREMAESGTLAKLRRFRVARQKVNTAQSIEELDWGLELCEQLLVESGVTVSHMQFEVAEAIGAARERLAAVYRSDSENVLTFPSRTQDN